MQRKLKLSEIATTRESLLSAQGNRCQLCSLSCLPSQAVLDHCHSTGRVRATLHRSCNALLGKVENNYLRYGLQNLGAFLHGASGYLQRHETDQTGLLHPTHKTDEDKRVRRNKLAAKRRAVGKTEKQ
jgi:hypothetical protein